MTDTGESKEREGAKEEKEEELFDLLIPPGVPRKIIADILQRFEVDLVERREKLFFANMDGIERDLLAFRGRADVVREVEKFLLARLREFIGEPEEERAEDTG